MVKNNHEWSKDALFSKAQRYVEEMQAQESDDWRFPFWAALSLELLIKATLANISPVLIADLRNEASLLHALQLTTQEAKTTAKTSGTENTSAPTRGISELTKLARKLVPEFSDQSENFCILMLQRRNSELHSGALPFDACPNSKWLPSYYEVCAQLLNSLEIPLEVLFGSHTSEVRNTIEASRDEQAKKVNQLIAEHRAAWEAMDDAERLAGEQRSVGICLRSNGHRAVCPSCGHIGLIFGRPVGVGREYLEEQAVMVRERMSPEKFECVACGLKVGGYAKLLVAGLGDDFTATRWVSPSVYFDVEDDYLPAWLEDFND